jgi:hypothetical protein
MSYIGNQPTSVAFLTDTFSGNASATAFTLSAAPATTSSVLVAVSGVLQDPSTYSVAGTTLTFSAAPPIGTGNISVRFLGIPASGVTTTAYRTVTEFTATSGQTTFSVPSYTVGYIDVYRNGVMLGSADYTATDGVSVVLAAGATAGDLIETISFYVSSVLNAIPGTAGSVGTTYLADNSVTTAKIADANVTQAKLATNVVGTGPAFSAYSSVEQSLTAGTVTKITFGAEEFDTNNNFASSRFTPTVAGYYQVTGGIQVSSSFTTIIVYIYKNGSVYKNVQYISTNGAVASGTTLVYMNGSTDYVELYGTIGSTQNISSGADRGTYFQASLVRAV